MPAYSRACALIMSRVLSGSNGWLQECPRPPICCLAARSSLISSGELLMPSVFGGRVSLLALFVPGVGWVGRGRWGSCDVVSCRDVGSAIFAGRWRSSVTLLHYIQEAALIPVLYALP